MHLNLPKIIDLRQKLHKIAELSGKEYQTSAEIVNFVQKFGPAKIIKFGETALAAVYDSGREGKTTIFRAELDAVAVDETENFDFIHNAAAHKCGHDGHMAILCGLAETIHHNLPKSGKVVLLFQHAEENVKGALEILDNDKFADIEPDLIFGFHNIPNKPAGSLIFKYDNFNYATIGTVLRFIGKTAHAAYPQLANNPTKAVFEFIQNAYNVLKINNYDINDLVFTHVNIGQPNFGLVPEKADIFTTLRAIDYVTLNHILKLLTEEALKHAQINDLEFSRNDIEYSVEIQNSKEALDIVLQAVADLKMQTIEVETPFRWGEDFGFLSQDYNSAYFGIGNGDCGELHTEDYHFNDNIILPTVKLLYSIYTKIHQ